MEKREREIRKEKVKRKGLMKIRVGKEEKGREREEKGKVGKGKEKIGKGKKKEGKG